MVYSIDDIKDRIKPIAVKYQLPIVYIYGSYARNEATENSDIDILINQEGSKIVSFLDLCSLQDDLCEGLNKQISLITEQSLEQSNIGYSSIIFKRNVANEKVVVYDQS